MLNKKQLDCYKVAAFAQPLIVLGGWLPSTLRQRSSDGFITHCKGGALDSAMIACRQAQGTEYGHLLVLYRSRPELFLCMSGSIRLVKARSDVDCRCTKHYIHGSKSSEKENCAAQSPFLASQASCVLLPHTRPQSTISVKVQLHDANTEQANQVKALPLDCSRLSKVPLCLEFCTAACCSCSCAASHLYTECFLTWVVCLVDDWRPSLLAGRLHG